MDDASTSLLPTGLVARARAVLATRPSAVFTDFDGTLSPIAPTPAAARLAPGGAEALASVAIVADHVAVVSGRAVVDLREKVGREDVVYVGNHGLEYLVAGRPETLAEAAPFATMVDRAAGAVEAAVAHDGLRVDRKGVTASLHYRLCEDRAAARAAILDVLSRLPEGRELRVVEGRAVIEVRPPIDVNKGTALARLAVRWRLRGAIFLGDDVTDLDALVALRGLDGVETLGIAVRSPEADPRVCAAADHCVDGVADVVALLAALARPDVDRAER